MDKEKQICPVPRIKSGIKGLDKLVAGGFPKGHSILVCGTPGTGKTILGLQYLHKGITDFDQNGLFVSVEDHPYRLKNYAACFGWDFGAHEKAKRFSFLKVPIDQKGYHIVNKIAEAAKKVKAERMVLDSLSALTISARMFAESKFTIFICILNNFSSRP